MPNQQRVYRYGNFGPVSHIGTVRENTKTTTVIVLKVHLDVKRKPEAKHFNVKEPEFPFIGRRSELRLLNNTLLGPLNVSTKRPNSIVVSGLGGIGKTQLVRKFVDEHKDSYGNVVWIDSDDPIINSLHKVAEQWPSTNIDGKRKKLKSIIEEVLNILGKRKTLIVLDNVDKCETIKMLITTVSKGEKPHFIITTTTRSQDWDDEINTIQLKVWDYDDAFAYVSTTLGGIPMQRYFEEEKMLLVKKLHYFPLTLRQATDYIIDQRKHHPTFGIRDYINKYDKHTQEMLDSRVGQRGFRHYNETTYTTWNRTINEVKNVEEVGPLAVEILNIIAYFSPNNISGDIFVHHTFHNKCCVQFISNILEGFKLYRKDQIDYKEKISLAVRLLVNSSMVEKQESNNGMNVHILLQQVMKLKLQETNQEKSILRDAIILISKLIEHGKLNACHSHAVSVFRSVLKYRDLIKEFSTLVCKNKKSTTESNLRNSFH